MTAENKAVFLSYASQDADAARRICEALCAAGVEVWSTRASSSAATRGTRNKSRTVCCSTRGRRQVTALKGLKTFNPGRWKSCSLPVAITRLCRRAMAAM